MEQLIHWDQELFLYLNQLGNNTFDSFWLVVTNKKTWIPLYVLLFYILVKKLGIKQAILCGLCAGAMIGVSDQVATLFKEVWVQRPRPCHQEGVYEYMRLVKDGCGGKFGFYSAHAANHIALAIFIGSVLKPYYKYALYILLIWAAAIAYSRIYIGVHYPLDVLSGSFSGVIWSFLALILFKFLSVKFFKLDDISK